jgi:hypothetical protein
MKSTLRPLQLCDSVLSLPHIEYLEHSMDHQSWGGIIRSYLFWQSMAKNLDMAEKVLFGTLQLIP